MNVVPAVWAGLFGLFRLRSRSTMRCMGPAADHPEHPVIPSALPISGKAILRLSFVLQKRRGAGEQATKPVFRYHKPLLGMARENARGAQSHSTHAECSEELPSTDPTPLIITVDIHSCLPVCKIIIKQKTWFSFFSPPFRSREQKSSVGKDEQHCSQASSVAFRTVPETQLHNLRSAALARPLRKVGENLAAA